MMRIRGRVAEPCNDPTYPEHKGKYFFEVHVCKLDGEMVGEPLGPFGPYETHKKALRELKNACQKASECIELKVAGKTNGQYIDMLNNGVLRKWAEH